LINHAFTHALTPNAIFNDKWVILNYNNQFHACTNTVPPTSLRDNAVTAIVLALVAITANEQEYERSRL